MEKSYWFSCVTVPIPETGSQPPTTMNQIAIRECISIDELDSCIRLQREVFGLPDLEISPRRHLIVSRQAGGWTLGAFVAQNNSRSNAAGLVGFVHHLAAVK